ncbi:FAD/NAD(P)-binding domain-containing protein [Backusella circina FSU 941]|nr:FAD/NAD(P)-binding domain-containing protein [Backusella circina FSU 941]
MNILRTTTGRTTRLVRANNLSRVSRAYSTASPKNNSVPWAIGSILVFGPLLFKLTSPPPPKKQQHDVIPALHVPTKEEPKQEEPKAVVVEEVVKKIQKPYVLIGAGTASFAAAQAIKEKDPEANVIIIGDEEYAPYMRPPLSKELWFSGNVEDLTFKDWSGTERNAIYKDISEYQVIKDASGSDIETNKTKLLLGKPVTKLNVDDHSVTLSDGSVIYYHKVLLATGGKPKTLENVKGDHVTTFRNINDFKQLDKIAKEGAHVAIIGGGFLGSELAVALAHRGWIYKKRECC